MSKTCRIVISEFGKDICLLCFEVVCREVRKYGSLERIQEADTEVVVISVCYLRIGAGYADRRNAGIDEDISGCYGNCRGSSGYYP